MYQQSIPVDTRSIETRKYKSKIMIVVRLKKLQKRIRPKKWRCALSEITLWESHPEPKLICCDQTSLERVI